MKSYPVLENIAHHIQLSTDEREYFSSLLKPKAIRKKHFLLQGGEIDKHLTFVTRGCLRSYAIDSNGFEHVLQFAPIGWWIGDMDSLINQRPGTLFIDAVENSEILSLYKHDLDSLYVKIPKFERFFRIIAEKSLAVYQHRVINNMSLSAMERYHDFCQLYPSLIQCLPQKQVASYIGVTPEFLSKLLNPKP